MRRVMFIVGWLLVLAVAQASLNPTIGLLAVVACALHIGLVLGRRGRPPTDGLALGGLLRLAAQAATAPFRLVAWPLRRRAGRTQVDAIGMQVHLGDRGRAAAIERRLRATLRQCAHTWAPHPLPVDRIAVYAGAPAAGKAQWFTGWQPSGDPKQEAAASLAVISLGLLDAAGRPLDDQQLAGALAAQVAVLVAERYERQHATAAAAAASPSRPTARPARQPAADLVDSAASPDQELSVLMERLRQQAGPLEPESGPPPTAN